MLLHSVTGPAGDVYLQLQVWSGNAVFGGQNVRAAFDNVYITQNG